jgi:hypothetical protein
MNSEHLKELIKPHPSQLTLVNKSVFTQMEKGQHYSNPVFSIDGKYIYGIAKHL